MVSQSHIEFLQAFAELSSVTRRDGNQWTRLSKQKKLAHALVRKDPVYGYTLMGLLSCLEHDIPAMHAHHRKAIEISESCFSLIYYAASLEKSCLWSEATRYALYALDHDPHNVKILESVIKLAPLTGRFALYKRLLPQWQELHAGIKHSCHCDYEIVADVLGRHGIPEGDLKAMVVAIGDALSETNVIIQNFRYEFVSRRRQAPFIHFRYAVSDELAAAYYEEVVEAKLAQIVYHPRLHDAFSFSVENAALHQLYDAMEQERKQYPDDFQSPDPELMKQIEDLVLGVVV